MHFKHICTRSWQISTLLSKFLLFRHLPWLNLQMSFHMVHIILQSNRQWFATYYFQLYEFCVEVVFLFSFLIRHSLVGKATRLQVGRPRNRVLIPGRGKRFITLTQRPDRLWFPASLIFNGKRGIVSGVKAAEAWSWPRTQSHKQVINDRSYTFSPLYAFMSCTQNLPLLCRVYIHRE
jgi:hypothetical protein